MTVYLKLLLGIFLSISAYSAHRSEDSPPVTFKAVFSGTDGARVELSWEECKDH